MRDVLVKLLDGRLLRGISYNIIGRDLPTTEPVFILDRNGVNISMGADDDRVTVMFPWTQVESVILGPVVDAEVLLELVIAEPAEVDGGQG